MQTHLEAIRNKLRAVVFTCWIYDIIVSEFEPQLHYYVHFLANILLSPPVMG